MANSNSKVIDAFLNKRPLQGTNLSTDGITLWSYHWWQMATHTNDTTLTVRNGPAYSSSTAKQRSLLYSALRQRNHVNSESNPTAPITILQSELTPRMLGHMIENATERERVANGGFSNEHYRSY